MDQLERVFAFDDPVEFLNFELRERQKKIARFSLRAWSRQVGYKNPSYLSHVLGRKRRLKPEFASKLAANLELKGRSLKYFELLVLNQNAATESEQETYRKLMSAARPRRGSNATNQLSLETFSLIADWYHWAILEMTDLADFDGDPRAIQRKLCSKVDLKTIQRAIGRLLRAGLLTHDGGGHLVRANKDTNNETEAPAQPEAVIAYHKQMGELAVKAVAGQPRCDRDFFGSTLTIRRENFEKVQEILKEAHRQVIRYAEHGKTGDDVYQLNTQFFRLAGTPKKKRKQDSGRAN
jgi:uncharacterized protein (TIGR02147 family)